MSSKEDTIKDLLKTIDEVRKRPLDEAEVKKRAKNLNDNDLSTLIQHLTYLNVKKPTSRQNSTDKDTLNEKQQQNEEWYENLKYKTDTLINQIKTQGGLVEEIPIWDDVESLDVTDQNNVRVAIERINIARQKVRIVANGVNIIYGGLLDKLFDWVQTDDGKIHYKNWTELCYSLDIDMVEAQKLRVFYILYRKYPKLLFIPIGATTFYNKRVFFLDRLKKNSVTRKYWSEKPFDTVQVNLSGKISIHDTLLGFDKDGNVLDQDLKQHSAQTVINNLSSPMKRDLNFVPKEEVHFDTVVDDDNIILNKAKLASPKESEKTQEEVRNEVSTIIRTMNKNLKKKFTRYIKEFVNNINKKDVKAMIRAINQLHLEAVKVLKMNDIEPEKIPLSAIIQAVEKLNNKSKMPSEKFIEEEDPDIKNLEDEFKNL